MLSRNLVIPGHNVIHTSVGRNHLYGCLHICNWVIVGIRTFFQPMNATRSRRSKRKKGYCPSSLVLVEQLLLHARSTISPLGFTKRIFCDPFILFLSSAIRSSLNYAGTPNYHVQHTLAVDLLSCYSASRALLNDLPEDLQLILWCQVVCHGVVLCEVAPLVCWSRSPVISDLLLQFSASEPVEMHAHCFGVL